MSRFGGLLSLGEGLGPENCAAFAAGPSAHMRALPSSPRRLGQPLPSILTLPTGSYQS